MYVYMYACVHVLCICDLVMLCLNMNMNTNMRGQVATGRPSRVAYFCRFQLEIHVSPGTRTKGPTRLVTDLNLYTSHPKHTKHTPEPESRGPMPRDRGVAYPKRFRVNMPSHMGVNMPRSIGVSYPSGC